MKSPDTMVSAKVEHISEGEAEKRRSRYHSWPLILSLAASALAPACAASPTEWRRQQQQAFEARRDEIPEEPPASKTDRKRRWRRGRTRPEAEELNRLAASLNATPLAIERPCINSLCTVRALDETFDKLDRLDRKEIDRVRILHLGDSHIAADYITRTIRERLQDRYGNGGRGYIAVDQRDRYGGRRLKRTGWKRERVVDEGGAGRAFGVSGMSLESNASNVSMSFGLVPEDDLVAIYFEAHPSGAGLKVYAESEELAAFSTRSSGSETRAEKIEIPMHAMGDAVPPKWLEVRADGRGARVFGLSFESEEPGLIYDAIGPVGADAKVYLQFEQASMIANISALAPDLIVIMVGGNDALMLRKGVRSNDDVRKHHESLIRRMRNAAPDAECLLWAPMDAGERVEGSIVTKDKIVEVRDIQRQVAEKLGCAFWDVFEAMGGRGAFGRWLQRGLMNDDMVHPRSKGGDLIGHLFSQAFMTTYLQSE